MLLIFGNCVWFSALVSSCSLFWEGIPWSAEIDFRVHFGEGRGFLQNWAQFSNNASPDHWGSEVLPQHLALPESVLCFDGRPAISQFSTEQPWKKEWGVIEGLYWEPVSNPPKKSLNSIFLWLTQAKTESSLQGGNQSIKCYGKPPGKVRSGCSRLDMTTAGVWSCGVRQPDSWRTSELLGSTTPCGAGNNIHNRIRGVGRVAAIEEGNLKAVDVAGCFWRVEFPGEAGRPLSTHRHTHIYKHRSFWVTHILKLGGWKTPPGCRSNKAPKNMQCKKCKKKHKKCKKCSWHGNSFRSSLGLYTILLKRS